MSKYSEWQFSYSNFMRKRLNGERNVRNFRRSFCGMSCDVPAFRFCVFASDFECLIGLKGKSENITEGGPDEKSSKVEKNRKQK